MATKGINIVIFMAITVALAWAQTPMTPGVIYSAATPFRGWTYFSLNLTESTINYVKLVTTGVSGTPYYYANIGYLPTFQNNIWKYENVTGGPITKYLYTPNVDLRTGNYSNTVLYIGIYGYASTKYDIVAYTLGPINRYNRQVTPTNFPPSNSFTFYKFVADPSVRTLQVVTKPNYYFYMSLSNYTSSTIYPVSNGRYQYKSSYNSATKTQCLIINYPTAGTYRVGVSTYENQNFTIQFVENGLGSCDIE